jgi:HMG (high mobility group) box
MKQEGQVLLDDPLEAFANDEVHVDVDDVDPSSNNMMGISSSSISTPVPGVDDDDDDDNIKPPYPEDTVDDEGHLVDEHDDDNDDDHDALDIDDEEDLRKDLSINSKPASIAAKKAPSSPKHRKKRDVTVMRKAPQAPKRFKSSYICFFTSKQSEIKEILGDKATVMEISKKSAQMWKELGAEERSHWEDVAAKDKERYMIEKATYSGPWQVPYKRTKKDPSAPKVCPNTQHPTHHSRKLSFFFDCHVGLSPCPIQSLQRPMSAFLLFSQGRRGNIKEDNPGMKNTEISRLLGEQWRNCTDAERLPFVEEEKELREKYKIALSEWKEKEGERKEEEMKRRKEQLEWQKRQHQLAMEKAQHYAQQHNNVHLPMDPFTHPMYAMHPPPPSQGYPGYQPQGYPVQYGKFHRTTSELLPRRIIDAFSLACWIVLP